MVFIPTGFDIRYLCGTNIKYPFISPCDNQNFDTVLASSAVDRGFVRRSGQTKDYKIGICCFFPKHAALRRKSTDWLPRNQNNVSECGEMSICLLLFQWDSTIKIQLSVLILCKPDLIIISPWYIWKDAELALSNNHLLIYLPRFEVLLELLKGWSH